MPNNVQLIKILNLFKLDYYEKNGKEFILDSKTEETAVLETDGKNGYKFNIGDIRCYFNESLVVLDMNDVEFVINGMDVSYLRTDLDTQCVTKSFNFNNDAVSFYSSNDATSSSLTFYYDNDSNIYRMRKAESFTDNLGVSKEDLDFYSENNNHVKHIIRRYDLNGKMVTGFSFVKTSDVPISDCIYDQIKTNTTILEIIDEMESNIPGIIDFCNKINPIMKNIIAKVGKTYQK